MSGYFSLGPCGLILYGKMAYLTKPMSRKEAQAMKRYRKIAQKGREIPTYELRDQSRNGHFMAVRFLVGYGPTDSNIVLAIRGASSKGHLEIVKLLMPKWLDRGNVYSFIYLAIDEGHLEVVKYLFSYFTSRGHEISSLLPQMLREAVFSQRKNIIRYFLSFNKVQLALKKEDDKTFNLAIDGEQLEAVRFMHKHGALFNDIASVRAAAKKRHPGVVKFLVSQGAYKGWDLQKADFYYEEGTLHPLEGEKDRAKEIETEPMRFLRLDAGVRELRAYKFLRTLYIRELAIKI